MMRYNVLVLFALVAVANSKYISFQDCSYSRSRNSIIKNDKDCIIHSVQLLQCEGPDMDYQTCRVTHNRILNIVIEYSPNYQQKLNARMFWNRPPNETVIHAMNEQACLSNGCLSDYQGKNITYFAEISMYKQYPDHLIDDIRWILFADSVQHSQCCVEFPIIVYN